MSECTMSESAKAAQREYKRRYMREWRKRNPEKVKANNAAYWERQAEKVRKEDAAGNLARH